MIAGAFITSLSAINREETDLLLILDFFLFLTGTFGMIAHLRDTERPYMHHLKAGFAAGLGVTAFALFSNASRYTSIALGMWAQTFMMTARALLGDRVSL